MLDEDKDNYFEHQQDVSSVSVGNASIAPSDSVDLANSEGQYPTAFYLNSDNTGAVRFVDLYDNIVTHTFGEGWHPVRVKKIMLTGTAAGVTSILLSYQADPNK